MRCRECDFEVKNNAAFCPKCGAPVRVVADYDYIQAQIGGKVNSFLDDGLDEDGESGFRDEGVRVDNGNRFDEERKARQRKEELSKTITFTKKIYEDASIFDDEEGAVSNRRNMHQGQPQRNSSDPRRRNSSARSSDGSGGRNDNNRKKNARRKKLLIICAAILAFILIVVVLFLAIFGKKEKPETPTEDVIVCNLTDGEEYTAPVDVTFTSQNNYRIYYTLDGTEPSVTSYRFAQTFQIGNKDLSEDSQEVKINVVTFTESSVKAGSLSLTVTIDKSTVDAPTIEPGSGDYYEATDITISGPEGTEIRYTYDGTEPTESSPIYSGPIKMKRGNFIVQAIAIDQSGVKSSVTQCVYNLSIPSTLSYDDAYARVQQMLIQRGLIVDESGKVAEGGKRTLSNGGTVILGENNYLVIQVDYFNDESATIIQGTSYYGVDDQTGNIIELSKSGSSYVFK